MGDEERRKDTVIAALPYVHEYFNPLDPVQTPSHPTWIRDDSDAETRSHTKLISFEAF